MKKRFLYVLIPALLLICFTACAAGMNAWGIGDFLSRYQQQVLPAGREMANAMYYTQTPGETSLVSFRVTEAIHDGSRYYVVVEAAPKTNNQLLVSQADWNAQTHVSGDQWQRRDYLEQLPEIMGPDYGGAAGSIGEYIEEKGLEITLVNFYLTEVGLPGSIFTLDHVLNGEGAMYFLFGGSYETEDETMALQFPFFHEMPDGSGKEETLISVTIPTNQPMERASMEKAVVFPQSGLRVEALDVVATPFSMTVKMNLIQAVPSDPWKPMHLSIRDEGGRPQDVTLILSSSDPDEDGRYTQETMLQPQAEIPETLILSYYGEEVEVPLIKIDE